MYDEKYEWFQCQNPKSFDTFLFIIMDKKYHKKIYYTLTVEGIPKMHDIGTVLSFNMVNFS